MTDPARAAAMEMDCCRCFSSHFVIGRSDHSSIRLDHLKALNIPRLKRPQPQGQHFREWPPLLERWAPHPLSHFYSTPFHSFSPSSDSVLRSMHHSFFFSSPSSSSLAILYMYIYKSAHNWCLGKSKEQWGREAIRGIKRGAASQPSFTGQWSKSNWVLFCGRTHVRTDTHTHTDTTAHIYTQWQWWRHIAVRRAFGTQQGWACLRLAHQGMHSWPPTLLSKHILGCVYD